MRAAAGHVGQKSETTRQEMKATIKGTRTFIRVGLISLLILGAAGQPIAVAQSAGTFIETGGMKTNRANHTATLLTNGKVLIAGGWVDINRLTATTELYDPANGIFTSSGEMMASRSHHTATLLPDGKVLITGGLPATNSAEIYDPYTGTFARTGQMVSDHQCQQAHLLANGRVLVAGGTGPGHKPGAELYDSSSGTFAATAPYVNNYSGFNHCQGAASSLLPD